MYSLTTNEQLAELGEELKDRFGQHPVELQNLLGAVRVRLTAGELGFSKVVVGRESVDLEFLPDSRKSFYESESFQVLMNEISHWKEPRLALTQPGKSLHLTARIHEKENQIEAAAGFLRALADSVNSVQSAHLVAATLPPDVRQALINASNQAYIAGMNHALIVGTIVLAVAAVFVILFLPAKIRHNDEIPVRAKSV